MEPGPCVPERRVRFDQPAWAVTALALGAGSLVTWGAGSFPALLILFRSRHRGRDRRIVPQLVTWIGGGLGALALFEVVCAWRPVVMRPGGARGGRVGMS